MLFSLAVEDMTLQCPIYVLTLCLVLFYEGEYLLQDKRNVHGRDMLVEGLAPRCGQVFRNPNIANTLKVLAK